jgi:hypothetical protein
MLFISLFQFISILQRVYHFAKKYFQKADLTAHGEGLRVLLMSICQKAMLLNRIVVSPAAAGRRLKTPIPYQLIS